MKKAFVSALLITSAIHSAAEAGEAQLALKEAARFSHNIFDKSAAEIIVYSAASKQFFLVNGASPSVDILALKDGTLLQTGKMQLTNDESPTSVAVSGDLVAVAVHKVTPTGKPGKLLLFTAKGERLAELPLGDLPDMVTFSADGTYILVANEGEPAEKADPEGSVSIITLDKANPAASVVRTVDFQALDAETLRKNGIRIFPKKTPAEDIEPEYIAVAGTKAYVTLQENNAVAVIDIPSATLENLFSLGYKDHSLPGNGLDTDDKDKVANIKPMPLRGLYMPDSIAAFAQDGKTYLVTANEGDARDEDVRIAKASLDPALAKKLMKASVGDRLKISSIDGDADGDGDLDLAYTYGARSFSIWTETGEQVFDSGDQFAEKVLGQLGYDAFNSTNDENKPDNRSDDKGVEPEGVAIGTIKGRIYAFIGLERVGGIMVYDVTVPAKATFVSYFNDRNFDTNLDPSLGPDQLAKVGHLGPEGVTFISAENSPYDKPTLAVGYEVSGSVGLYTIE